jgi:hypothetical protein
MDARSCRASGNCRLAPKRDDVFPRPRNIETGGKRAETKKGCFFFLLKLVYITHVFDDAGQRYRGAQLDMTLRCVAKNRRPRLEDDKVDKRRNYPLPRRNLFAKGRGNQWIEIQLTLNSSNFLFWTKFNKHFKNTLKQ